VLEGGHLDVREHFAVKDLARAGALLRWSGGTAKGENERDEYSVQLPMRVGNLGFLGHVVFHGPDSMKRACVEQEQKPKGRCVLLGGF